MKQIPASLQEGPQRSIVLPDASLTWYRARPDGPPGRFLVTQPTLSFVRTGMKHLQPHGAEEHLVVSAGSVVTMGAGIHVMTELGGGAPHYERTVLSVSPALLQSLLGARGGDSARTPAAVAPTPPRLCTMLSPPLSAPDADLWVREAVLVAAGLPRVRALLFREAARWGRTEVDRLRAVMQTHSLSPLSVPENAALSAMSLTTFKRRFREVFDESPGRWLARARLQHARWLIVVEQCSVTDACIASCFGDLSNFIRQFRRHFGLSPRKYRAAHAGSCI